MRSSYRMFQAMAGPRHGVSWRPNYVVSEQPISPGPFQEAIRDVLPELAMLKPGQHPFGSGRRLPNSLLGCRSAIVNRSLRRH